MLFRSYGRATDNASILIRLGKLTRKEGIELVKHHEGKLPEKYLGDFLSQWDMSREEFMKTVDKFANKDLFKQDSKGNLLRDERGNIEKTNYDN